MKLDVTHAPSSTSLPARTHAAPRAAVLPVRSGVKAGLGQARKAFVEDLVEHSGNQPIC